jgi:Protein of unknown function (DUF2924)
MARVSKAPSADLGALESLNIDALRAAWRERFNAEPPAFRAADLMRRALASKLQEAALGRDLELDKQIASLVRNHERGRAPSGPKPSYREGALVVREYDGVTHHVEVLANGYRWNGKTWRSLSEIAREITRVRWNGPRFFGLRSGRAEKRA